jgi:hypothetical protein
MQRAPRERLCKLHSQISKPFHTENFQLLRVLVQEFPSRLNLIVINYLCAGKSFMSDNKLETFCFVFFLGCVAFVKVCFCRLFFSGEEVSEKG